MLAAQPLLAVHMVVLIVIVVAVGILGTVVSIFVIKSMKGKLRLELEKGAFHCGELIGGRLTVELKKDVETRRLFVALVGYEEREVRESDGDTRKERDEVYREEQNLAVDVTLPAGHVETYTFQIPAPQNMDSGGGGGWLSGVELRVGGMSLGMGGRNRLLWYVEARLDTPGLDLTASRRVRIND